MKPVGMDNVERPRLGNYGAAGVGGAICGVVAVGSGLAFYRQLHGCLRPGAVCDDAPLDTAIMAGAGGILLAIVAGLIVGSLLRLPVPALLATLGLGTVALFMWVPLHFSGFDDAWPWLLGLAAAGYGLIAAVSLPDTPKQVRLAALAVLVADAIYLFAVPK